MFSRALSGWRTRSAGIVAGIAACAALSACGSGQRQDAQEPSATFPVEVTTARFPTSQTLSQHTHLVIEVRNVGHRTIPDIAVTITDPRRGTAIQAFGQSYSETGLANHSRPVWIVDRPPEPNGKCGYSCRAGGPGGAVTAYSDTWAMGRLAPGQVARFDWGVTAVATGHHSIRYEVAAGLNGKAKARLSGGGLPWGVFNVNISNRPAQAYVNNQGQIVTTQ
jgi:hypothetical protein